MTRESRRPRVICHMMATIDGRIVADRWPAFGDLTMEPMAGAVRDTSEVSRDAAAQAAGGAERADHVARSAHTPCAVAVDPSGRLLWQTSDVNGDHVVTILGHRVSDAYLGALRQRGVSYLFDDERPGR